MKIEKNPGWITFEQLFDSNIVSKYNWFLFEFGKRMTYLVHQHLLGQLSKVKGTADYKKRLVVAEIRDQSNRSWWAIVAKNKVLGQSEYDASLVTLNVVSRFDLGPDNAVSKILIGMGPWTADMIPFVPSLRQAVVFVTDATEKEVLAVKEKNLANKPKMDKLMQEYKIIPQSRLDIYEKLHVVPDWVIESLRIEFGLTGNGKAAWRNSIRWAKRDGVRRIMSESDLFAAFTNPAFQGFQSIQHILPVMNNFEVRALEKYQNRIRV